MENPWRTINIYYLNIENAMEFQSDRPHLNHIKQTDRHTNTHIDTYTTHRRSYSQINIYINKYTRMHEKLKKKRPIYC